MSRATAPPAAAFAPDPPSLRAPSRGRRAQHQHVPFRAYGFHAGAPRSAPQSAGTRHPTHARGAGTAHHAQPGSAGKSARGSGTISMHGWHMAGPETAGGRGPTQASSGAVASPVSSGAGSRPTGAGRHQVVAGAAAAGPHAHNRHVAAAAFNAISLRSARGYQQRQQQHYHRQHYTSHQHHYMALAHSLHAARLEWAADARHRLQALKTSGATASGSGSSGTLQVGSLVEFEKNDRGILAVVAAPDGKKNWFVVDQSGRRQSITPKQVQLLLPGAGYTAADVTSFSAAAESADMSLLEIVWEIALEGGVALQLQELAALLFDDTTPRTLYVTYRMMQRDILYFKQTLRGGATSYLPRSSDDVAALRRQQEEADAARLAAESWKAAVAAAKGAKTRAQQPTAAEWRSGPFAHRIAAVQAVALSSRTDDVTMQLALSSLQLAGAGSRAEAEAAAGLLIDIGVFRRHEPLHLLRRGLELQPPEDQERSAQAMLASPPPDPDAVTREDLTHLHVFTVDDASTTEVDDGLSVEQLPGGAGVRIWIHVADPTRWIQPGSSLDLAGRERIRTLYLPWGAVPMFPRALAEGPFSLREGQVCDAMSVGVVLGRDGSVTQPRLVPSRVRVSHKLTYDQADSVLAAEGEAGAAGGPVLDAAAAAELQELQRAALARRAYRESRGCIEIPLPEARIQLPADHLDRARPAVSITRISQWESVSRALVAEMMILAGEAIGAIGAEAALPLPYRGQDAPDLPPRRVLDALPEGPCRGFALKRCMTRSTVGAEPQRHASLALDAYVQFTSPIRRYGDVIAHFNLKAWLRGEPLPFSAAQIDSLMASMGETGRELGVMEREGDSYWVAEYLRLNWGAEYPAMVLGWQREDLQLVAFLLEEQGLEVVSRVPAGTAFAPGDRCVLVPSEANPATGFYRFYIAGWTSGHASGDDGSEGEEGGEVVGEEEEGEGEAAAQEDGEVDGEEEKEGA